MWEALAAQLAKSAMEAQERRRRQNDARMRQRASIGAQRAREHGFPVYGIEAAELNRTIADENEPENPLAMMIAKGLFK